MIPWLHTSTFERFKYASYCTAQQAVYISLNNFSSSLSSSITRMRCLSQTIGSAAIRFDSLLICELVNAKTPSLPAIMPSGTCSWFEITFWTNRRSDVIEISSVTYLTLFWLTLPSDKESHRRMDLVMNQYTLYEMWLTIMACPAPVIPVSKSDIKYCHSSTQCRNPSVQIWMSIWIESKLRETVLLHPREFGTTENLTGCTVHLTEPQTLRPVSICMNPHTFCFGESCTISNCWFCCPQRFGCCPDSKVKFS